jgi:glycosyltransferase involved in cell wall biosynthesis
MRGRFALKVLVVNRHFEDGFGGSEIQCDIVATQLAKLGHDVVYGIINARKASYDVSYKWVSIGEPFPIGFYKVLKRLKPDLVYWRLNKNHLLAAALLTHYQRKAFVFHISSAEDTERWSANGGRSSNPKDALKKNRFFYLAKDLLDNIHCFPNILFNYYGFHFVDAVICEKDDDMNKLPVKTQVKIYDSATSNYKPFKWDKPFVIWIASLKPRKNPERYIELAAKFQERNVDFLMIGSIVVPEYKYILDKANLPSNFHYLGTVKTTDDVNGVINSSLFLVHTCEPEGFSCVFQQAWLQGKPVISLYFDPEEIITKNQVGFVSGSPQRMIEDTEKLITNEKLRTSMGEKARELAIERFSAETNAKRIESLFLEVLERRLYR